MNELKLVESKDLRDEFIDRIDVLERVKNLLVLPDIEMATTQQVADFYEVDINAIKKVIERNKNELTIDGYNTWKAKNFISDIKSPIKTITNRGSFEVIFTNGQKEKFAPRGVALFPRRAILRVGMLLRDSEVAKEIRTQLLNIEGKVSTEQKISSITEEQQLALKVLYASDDSERLMAFSRFNDYKNKYINSLENKNDVLVTGNLTWKTREGINAMVRRIAAKTFNNNFAKAWDKVYGHMLYKYNVGINSRKVRSMLKKPTIFDVLSNEEIKLLAKSCLSLCEMYKIYTDDLIMEEV